MYPERADFVITPYHGGTSNRKGPEMKQRAALLAAMRSNFLTPARLAAAWILFAGLGAGALGADIETVEIGLTSDSSLIEAMRVAAGDEAAGTVILIGGLGGSDASSVAVRAAIERYAAAADAERRVDLIAIPVANPASQPLVFPPTGAAYRENSESFVLWRWLGLSAPDQVLVVGPDEADLTDALGTAAVAGVATIPARAVATDDDLLRLIPTDPEPSPAHIELEARRAQTPLEFANRLAPIYGQSFDPPIYIDGMALIAHLGLGDLEHVEALAAPYINGVRDSLGGAFGVSSLTQAGHLVFAELARRTGDPRYVARARAAADLAFADDGTPLEAMPSHGEMSDSIFMGASILAVVGELTGERRYHDMAVRHIAFMNELVRRDDGLYRHSPLTDAAWGRGNGFAAIGHALTLSSLPEDHPAHGELLGQYRDYMATLAGWQNADGTWRQVIDVPGAWHETSSTAIIGFSMQRGLNRGWLDAGAFDAVVERAWLAVLARTDREGAFIDVSESTNKQPSLEAYLAREALAGVDPRTGSFAMLFAVERAAAED